MLRQKRLLGNGSEAAEDRRGANATQGFMPHDVALITTIAGGFALAFIFGFIANRLGLPRSSDTWWPGLRWDLRLPASFADSAMAGQLAEIGVMLLMIGIGLHFSVADLLTVRDCDRRTGCCRTRA